MLAKTSSRLSNAQTLTALHSHKMARRSAPSAGPAFVPHPSQRRQLAGDDEDQSAFSRFIQNEILAPEKIQGNINIVTGLTVFFGGIVAVRTWGELMIPA